ncbi:MAG: hypothetical protein Kow00109_18270 [Acidobacteriota bacterium]
MLRNAEPWQRWLVRILRRDASYRRLLRCRPAAAVRVGGSWRRIKRVRPLGWIVEILAEGGGRVRLPDDVRLQERWEKVQEDLLEVLRRCLRRSGRASPERISCFGRYPWLYAAGRWSTGRDFLALLVAPETPRTGIETVLMRLVRLADRKGPAAAYLVVVPAHWREAWVEYLELLRLPITGWRYFPNGNVEQIFPRPRETAVAPSSFILHPFEPRVPEVLRKVQMRCPGSQLRFRGDRWEVSWRGLPLAWGVDDAGYWFDYLHPRPLRPEKDSELDLHLAEVRSVRNFPPPAPRSPYYRVLRERWLESLLVERLPGIFPDLTPDLYAQVPSLVEGERRVIDLLGATRDGRLVVLELKASQDPGLLLQGLEYWERVRRHLAAGDFERHGYFPSLGLSPQPPMLVLVTPLFEFHRLLKTVRRYLAVPVEIVCLGVNQDWRRGLRVLRRFRL